jgi:hypothetical protein
MSDPTFELLVYHHRSQSGHRIAYLGGDILQLPVLIHPSSSLEI